MQYSTKAIRGTFTDRYLQLTKGKRESLLLVYCCQRWLRAAHEASEYARLHVAVESGLRAAGLAHQRTKGLSLAERDGLYRGRHFARRPLYSPSDWYWLGDESLRMMAHAPDLPHERATKLESCHRCLNSAFGEHSSRSATAQKNTTTTRFAGCTFVAVGSRGIADAAGLKMSDHIDSSRWGVLTANAQHRLSVVMNCQTNQAKKTM